MQSQPWLATYRDNGILSAIDANFMRPAE